MWKTTAASAHESEECTSQAATQSKDQECQIMKLASTVTVTLALAVKPFTGSILSSLHHKLLQTSHWLNPSVTRENDRSFLLFQRWQAVVSAFPSGKEMCLGIWGCLGSINQKQDLENFSWCKPTRKHQIWKTSSCFNLPSKSSNSVTCLNFWRSSECQVKGNPF